VGGSTEGSAKGSEAMATAEVVSLRVGFRNVEVRCGRFLVNGQPIKLMGVNRHEHDCR